MDPKIRLCYLSKLNFCRRKRSFIIINKKITLSEISRVRFVQLLAKLQMRGYSLKQLQEDIIVKFALGSDIFVNLPTEFVKELMFSLFARVFDLLQKHEEPRSIAVDISPLQLISIMKDQVVKFSSKVIKCSSFIITRRCRLNKPQIKYFKFLLHNSCICVWISLVKSAFGICSLLTVS